MGGFQSEWHILRSHAAGPEIPLMFLQSDAVVSEVSGCFQPKGNSTLVLLLADEKFTELKS